MSLVSSFFDYIKAYRNYDPAAKSWLEVVFLYPGPKAVGLYRLAHFFYGLNFFFIARFISEVARWLTGIEIHPGAKIGKALVIDHGMGIVIGETSEIGDHCIIFHGVTLGGTSFIGQKRHPTVGSRVMIGAHAILLGPIVIGDDVKVGARAFVTKNINSGLTVIGSNQIKT